jgi:hypothetical protein
VANLAPVSTTPGANFATGTAGVVANNGNNIRLLTPLSEFDLQIYLREFSKKFEKTLMLFSGA